MVRIFRCGIWLPFLLIFTGCVCNFSDLGEVRALHANHDLDILYQDIDIPTEPLTLNDIIEIALQRNLELYVKQFQAAIEHETISRDALRMLPALNLTGELSGRSNLLASSSFSLVPGIPPAPLSTSVDSHKFNWEFTLIWNLLDFGLAYYRAREEANKALIADLEYKRLQQNLVLGVKKQYWKAIVAKKAMDVGKELNEKIQTKKEILLRDIQLRALSKVIGLNNEHRLLTTQLQMLGYRTDYLNAKAELANAMAIPPGIEFELAEPDLTLPEPELESLDNLLAMAIQNRPELLGLDLEEKNGEEEVRVQLLSLLPSISPFASDSFDSNSFLLHRYWETAGIRVAWDLLQTPLKLKNKELAEMQKRLAMRKRLNLSLGILVQVEMSVLLFKDAYKRYGLAKELRDNDAEIVRILNLAQKSGAFAPGEIINYEADALNSEIEALRTFGEMSLALEQLNNALGLPRFFDKRKSEEEDCSPAEPNAEEKNFSNSSDDKKDLK